MSDQTIHLIIKGHVQGVAYRNWMCNQAGELGISGWVRNLENGDVEALACGDEDSLKQLVQACHDGSPAARPIDVKTKSIENGPGISGFEQKPTIPPAESEYI